MGYRSDSIAVSRDMGPLSLQENGADIDDALPQGPCHIKNTTVIFIHYGGGKKTLRR